MKNGGAEWIDGNKYPVSDLLNEIAVKRCMMKINLPEGVVCVVSVIMRDVDSIPIN